MKAKIYLINVENPIIIENELSFKHFIYELFENKVYLSIPKNDSDSLAV